VHKYDKFLDFFMFYTAKFSFLVFSFHFHLKHVQFLFSLCAVVNCMAPCPSVFLAQIVYCLLYRIVLGFFSFRRRTASSRMTCQRRGQYAIKAFLLRMKYHCLLIIWPVLFLRIFGVRWQQPVQILEISVCV